MAAAAVAPAVQAGLVVALVGVAVLATAVAAVVEVGALAAEATRCASRRPSRARAHRP